MEPQPSTKLGRLRILAPTAGVRVSPLQLGTRTLGSTWTAAKDPVNKDSAFDLLDAFYEAGGNFIDTANTHKDEQSEKCIGEWMQSRRNRDSVVLATKFSMDYRSHALGKGPQSANFAGNSRRSIHVSIRDSLKKLQTDYIDIYYIHHWDYTTSIKEVMDALHILVEKGQVLYLGVSDTPAWVVAAANTYAVAHGKTPFSIYQGRWNIFERDFERDIIPMARHFGMALAPWDVFGGGKLYTRGHLEKLKDNGQISTFVGSSDGRTPQLNEYGVKMSVAMVMVAAQHGTDSVHAVALAYVMSKAANVFPLIGGRNVENLLDNIQALSIKLTDEQIQYLESIKPFDLGFPHNFIPADPNITGKSSLIAKTNAIKFPNAGRQTS